MGRRHRDAVHSRPRPAVPSSLGLYNCGAAVDCRASTVRSFESRGPGGWDVFANVRCGVPTQPPEPLYHGLHPEARSLAIRAVTDAVLRRGMVGRSDARTLSLREFLAWLRIRTECDLRGIASHLLLVAAVGVWAGPRPR